MALDALAVRCLANEINNAVTGGRIDKIHQPEKDEIVLHIRTFTDSFSLVLSAGSSHPRIHFTNTKKQNPITAPLFCMLLRKHLSGGKITGVYQKDFERIIIIDIESYNELGDLTVKHLITEIMGRHSNIILTDSDMRIIDCIKHVDITISSVRQVLPGMTYEFPPVQDKIPLTEFEGGLSLLPGSNLSKSLLGAISGISPLTAREIIYEAYGVADMHTAEVTDTAPLEKAILKMKNRLLDGSFNPCIIKDENALKITDFSAVDIRQYEGLMKIEHNPSMNTVLDSFYSGRDALERMKQKSADITKLLNTLLERCYKKRLILARTVKDSENKELYKIYGDLITSNMYFIEENATSVTVDNYYDPDCKQVTIALDPSMTPAQNAQRYYKKYTKAKTAEVEAAEQLTLNDFQIEYLESTLAAVENCTSENDINAIRRELADEGYIKHSGKRGQKPPVSKPLHFVSPDGFDIFAGKNNSQNDKLTLRTANTSDIWFHTKQIHGSHVVIKLGIDKDVPDSTLLIAAEIAAYYSKGRESNQVPVDYTTIRNVKKPNGAKPGMVIYDNYNTVYVKPNKHEELELRP